VLAIRTARCRFYKVHGVLSFVKCYTIIASHIFNNAVLGLLTNIILAAASLKLLLTNKETQNRTAQNTKSYSSKLQKKRNRQSM